MDKAIDSAISKLIKPNDAWLHRVIPFEKVGDSLHCYSDLNNTDLDELELLYPYNFKIQIVKPQELLDLLHNHYPKDHHDHRVNNLTYTGNSDNFLNILISEAKQLDSSDIHIEAYEDRCRIRIRIDGLMIERYFIEKSEYPAIINKIKILANLDISEKRLPQDGRIFFQYEQKQFDIRVSVLPTLHGEKVVLRLLSNDGNNIDIEKLGFSEVEMDRYMEGIKQPYGIILISGPTGSGKTTTLYATLKELNKSTKNILTIEDPIEYTLEGINQVQLKENIGFTFAAALKTFLRQDPDVIMVGEIRDAETANMAIRAALTGHLVFSTIHTNSAWGTVSRLIDMGLPPFLIASTLNVSVAQRLVRLLCPHCKREANKIQEIYPTDFKPYFNVDHYFEPQGCEHCFGTGYKGRKAIYEVLPIDQFLAQSIKLNTYDIGEYLAEKNIKTISKSAYYLFAMGQTSIDEIYPYLLNN